ncbi:MAG: MraY family glycosyltransferase [Candidatus Acidiferrales bacterium]
MRASIYLALFLASIASSLWLTYRVRRWANARGWVAKPESTRHIHTTSVPRLGGVAIFVSFTFVAGIAMLLPKSSWLVLDLSSRSVLSIFCSALIVFMLGLYDDLRAVGPYWKFAVQAVAAAILFWGGVGVHRVDLLAAGRSLQSAAGLPLTVLWILLITNAFNLIDGLDGLAAGSAFFSTVVVFVSSLMAPNGTVTLLAIVLAGAILGFLRFNFHPASIFLGDSGSMFIGFMLGALALASSQKAPTMIAVAIPVLSFGFPILDVCLAVSRRFVGGQPLFTADREHIHHKLLKRGLSQRGAVLVLYGVTAAFALLSLVVLHDAALIAVVLFVIGLGVALGVHYLGYPEFLELQELWRRASTRKRFVANNVAVRHAIAALNSCTDFVTVPEILQKTLQSVGFDGFRLESSLGKLCSDESESFFSQSGEHEIKLFWNDALNREPAWQLRLELTSATRRRFGYLCLLRATSESSLVVDINLLSRDFQAALSGAVLRTTNTEAIPAARIVQAIGTRSAKIASSASD